MSEHLIQRAVLQYLRVNAKPEIVYFSIPNGGLRNARVAQQMKAEGLRPGVADLCFMLPKGRCAWMELKTEKGRLSDVQIGFKTRCRELGHLWAMARSVDEAIPYFDAWNILRNSRRPSCFYSNPGPQQQAENCCDDCQVNGECLA
jgi:hypothetical protein